MQGAANNAKVLELLKDSFHLNQMALWVLNELARAIVLSPVALCIALHAAAFAQRPGGLPIDCSADGRDVIFPANNADSAIGCVDNAVFQRQPLRSDCRLPAADR